MKELFLVDKSAGWTSFDVVGKLRGIISKKEGARVKVGHAGTLDPFATGLLLVLVGQETKNQEKYMKLDKEYEATLKLGETSTTGDPEGMINTTKSGYGIPDERKIGKVLLEFLGESDQTPPAFSAIKVKGERAYSLARKGQKVELTPRKINIYALKMVSFKWPILIIQVSCSSGTYIRVLAEDIGNKLGCGAYLTDLRRLKIGNFDIKKAKTIDKIISELK